jgi:hopanoid biosynthesis associated radical SAM protein HpnH
MPGQPVELALKLTRYLVENKIRGRRRFPLTMILEPLEKCNLACEGCGRIREYDPVIDRMMTVQECLTAVEECGAPVVSIAGGEPLMHPNIDRIVEGIVCQRRFVYLCTNALLMKRALTTLDPSPYLAFVVHLDGLRETHDRSVGRRGVYDVAVAAIRLARRAGFRVCTNTTLYSGVQPQEFQALFAMLTKMGVEGIMVSPGFQFEEVAAKDIFLARQQATEFFRSIFEGCRNGTRFYNNPLYLDFLQGKRDYQCTPWTVPTRTPLGWRQPCYLIADQHVATFAELMGRTRWHSYGFGRDPRCATCMMHCGYEGSAILEALAKPAAAWEMARRALFSPGIGARR